MPDLSQDPVARCLEQMAHVTCGLPLDERSRKGAAEMARMFAQVAAVRFESVEEPFLGFPWGTEKEV